MSCNYELTQDRIKEAIDWVAEEKIVTDMQRHLKATRVQEVNKIATADVLKTILAALDAVRWRDYTTEPITDTEPKLIRLKDGTVIVGAKHDTAANVIVSSWLRDEVAVIKTDEIEAWRPVIGGDL